MNEYNEQAVETLDDAGCIIANKNIIIDNLQARIAELEEENARLKKFWGDATECAAICITENDELKEHLAASQAYAEQLREALENRQWDDDLDETACPIGTQSCPHCDGNPKRGHDSGCAIGKALAIPTSTEALDAYVAENERLKRDQELLVEAWNYGQFADDFNQPQAKPVRAAIRRFCEALASPSNTSALDAYVAEKVKEAGKFDMWKINPYTKVLETSIKQLTKQRDLAVDALEWALSNINCEPFEWSDEENADAHKAAIEALSAIKESEEN